MVTFNKFIIKILIIILYAPVYCNNELVLNETNSIPVKTIDHKINHNQSLYSQSYYQSKFSQIKFFSTMGLINSIYIFCYIIVVCIFSFEYINKKIITLFITGKNTSDKVQLKERIIFFILTIICPLICIVLKINYYKKFNKSYPIHWKYLASFLIMEIVFIILSFIGCFFTDIISKHLQKNEILFSYNFNLIFLLNIIIILIYYGIINSLLLSYFNFKNISMDDINHLNINNNNNMLDKIIKYKNN